MEKVSLSRPEAMAFYHPDGFVSAFKQAKAFAGPNGRVATLPDIVDAQLATKLGDFPWETYFVTMSAEYVGVSAFGSPIAIIAHGIGPMATLDGVLAAYGHEFNDKERNRRGGRISKKEFLKLETGKYGDVEVIDLVKTWNRRPYQFSGHAITDYEIAREPLWQARLGKKWREYVKRHSEFSWKWEKANNKHHGHSTPCIIAMDDASNCSYCSREMFGHWMKTTPGTAIAHLLTIGGLSISHHDYYKYDYNKREHRESLARDVHCHEWWNGTRLVGIGSGEISNIHPGLPDYDDLVEKHLDKLWKPNSKDNEGQITGFWHLVPMGKRYFTDYPKRGERMDNCEPEFLVTKIEEVHDGPKQFRTTVGGYHGFLKYGINEVRRIAPTGANAYTLGEGQIEWSDGNPTHHVMPITFYRVEVDTSRRLIRSDALYRDFNLIMSLVN